MNELSLFTGIGGGILGGVLCGWRTVCAVEIDPYCRAVLCQRQNDGILPPFPIWDDIRTFDGKPWRGRVDVVSGGFPCQPHSNAGKQLHEKDPRDLWPETAHVISDVMPKHVLLENVPGILSYLPVVIRDLRRIGYTVERPCIVASASVGAGHIRKRVWICAHLDTERQENASGESATEESENIRSAVGVGDCSKIPPDRNKKRKLQPEGSKQKQREWIGDCSWWKAEPNLDRVVYGIPFGMDRIGALGNAQVPAVARLAWEVLAIDNQVKSPRGA